MDAAYVSSTELTRSAGCTRKALRYYQTRGLIAPVRNSGNQRYDVSAIGRLRLIVALREAGIAVDDIAALLSTQDRQQVEAEAANGNGHELADQVGAVIASIGDRIAALHRLRDRLATSREALL